MTTKNHIFTVLFGSLLLLMSIRIAAQENPVIDGSILEGIRTNRTLICGVASNAPRFSEADLNSPNGYSGFDIDICRAVAAAILGDDKAITIVPIPGPSDRAELIRTGKIDLLSRNTTLTSARDLNDSWQATFGPIVFYDAQDVLVPAGVDYDAGLAGVTICATQSTTSIANPALSSSDMLPYANTQLAFDAFVAGECSAFTTDRSGIVGHVSRLPEDKRGAFRLLNIPNLSEEPLAPASNQNDQQFADVVRIVIYGLFTAEYLGINQNNIANYIANPQTDPAVIRFLGQDPETTIGQAYGLKPDFMVNVISGVGNYGDIYDRHLKDLENILPRGRNNLWINGGLIYAPPWR